VNELIEKQEYLLHY